MNTNTRKTNIFITIGAITLLVHAIGFLLPWCNMNGVKVQEGLAFIAGGSWVAIALCLGFELYFVFVRWQSRKLVTVCRALSVGASIAAFVTEIVIISDIKIGMASFGVGIYICIITLAVNIICCTAVCVLSIKDGTVQKA
jgi:hypothetical protein